MKLFNRSKSEIPALQEIKNMQANAGQLQKDAERLEKILRNKNTSKQDIKKQLLQIDQLVILLGEYQRRINDKLMPQE